MSKSHSTSLLLEDRNYDFLNTITKQRSVTKTHVINKALELYRKYSLRSSLREGFSSQDDEDVLLASLDFDDYQKIIEEGEK